MRSAPRGTIGPIEKFGGPGMTLIVVFGEEEVELPALDLADRVVDTAAAVTRRAVLALEPATRLEGVRVGATSMALEKLGWATEQW